MPASLQMPKCLGSSVSEWVPRVELPRIDLPTDRDQLSDDEVSLAAADAAEALHKEVQQSREC